MIPELTLALSGMMHARVRQHLFPGDGCEAAAILLCARTPKPRLRLIVRDVLLVPYADCSQRARDAIIWPGRWIEKAIDEAERDGLAILLVHSHPGGPLAFSQVDDRSDRRTIPSLFHAFGESHGSAVMTADGALRARLYSPGLDLTPIDLVTISSDDLAFYWNDTVEETTPRIRPMAFTSKMTEELGRLQAAVIGVSGTGSIVAEQLYRLGWGRILAIDFDRVEMRNLNRILNASRSDAAERRLKVETFATAARKNRADDVAVPVASSIATREAVLAASQADAIFCCVDTLEGRHIADLLASAFLLPLFDIGVVIPTRKSARGVAIADVCGRIDYVQPGGSTLLDRSVYSPETLRQEYLRRVAPDAHRQEADAGYIKGLVDQAPSVITLNMRAAAAGVNEFIARAYPFRLDPNRLYARTVFSLAACEEDYSSEDSFAATANPIVGRGDLEPLLGLPLLRAGKSGSTL